MLQEWLPTMKQALSMAHKTDQSIHTYYLQDMPRSEKAHLEGEKEHPKYSSD